MVSSRACIFYGLNVIRVLSIVTLLLVFASSIFVVVNDIEAVNRFDAARTANGTTTKSEHCDYIEGSTVPNQAAGVFWAVVQRLLLIFEVVILLISEFGWFPSFFERFFPVLAPSFGLGALGIFQGLIGATILSHHVDDFTLVAGFFLFSVGCLNMLVGLIFREKAKSKRSISEWRNGGHGRAILPTTQQDMRPVFTTVTPAALHSMVSDTSDSTDMHKAHAEWENTHAGYGFGRQGEKQAGLKGFLLARPIESLPRYATARAPSPTPSSSSRSSGSSRSSRSASPVDTRVASSHHQPGSHFSVSTAGPPSPRTPSWANAPPLPATTRRELSPARSNTSGPASPPGLDIDARPRYQLSDAPCFQSSHTAI